MRNEGMKELEPRPAHRRTQAPPAVLAFFCLVLSSSLTAIALNDGALAQGKSKKELTRLHDQLAAKLDLEIKRLDEVLKRCGDKEYCLQKEVCPVSLGLWDVARGMRDVIHELYYVHGVGYLSWVKDTEKGAEETGHSRLSVFGCK